MPSSPRSGTNPGNTIFPLNFFTYLGGSGPDSGQAIVVDSIGTAHVAGTTTRQTCRSSIR